ncbi:hypothetical protein ETU10_02465 [Apibacter muscae]|nr:hypothetical protein [Apibacter muscae]TWP24845.1 hypothetical protein ETU10_02465 [Apibacter muscae]
MFVLFIAVIIFNASKINYSVSLTSDPNDQFFYSGLVAVIGILVVFIVRQLRTIFHNHKA